MNTAIAQAAPWHAVLWGHARAHRLAAAGLLLGLLTVVLLLGQSLARIVTEGGSALALRYALLGGLAGFAATALGALPGLALRRVPQRVEDVMLGLAAGMMLAASAFSLLLPGLEAGERLFDSKLLGALVVVAGMVLGVLLMLGLDEFTPHRHEEGGPCGPGHERCSGIWLFVMAIALHNLPEGMAIGASFAEADLHVGLPLTTAIALQDVPEGLAVALALRAGGFSASRAVAIAVATGVLEPLGALLGVGLSTGLAVAYPIGLGLAGGAMIYVVSHEVIPETHRNGHQKPATLGLMAGFAIMMVLDTSFG